MPESVVGFCPVGELNFDGGIRVPMIARWPGKVPAGKVSNYPWAFWDFLPTIAELVGLTAPKGIDGISVLPALFGRRQPPHEYFYWETYSPEFRQAVRMGDWKGVRSGVQGPIEVYDLAKDVGESHNLAAAQPEIVRRMEETMRKAHQDSPDYKPIERKSKTLGTAQ